jgi:thiamine pyrophosphate-dependent acetolactate synthase large subunit-like protein
MADGYGRVSGALAAVSVHQGPGLTNTITGLTEAAKSRTPLLLLAADTPASALRSNFRIDQAGLVEAVGAVAERVHGPDTAMADVARAVRRARVERRAVVLMLPLDVQAQDTDLATPPAGPDLDIPRPSERAVAAAAEMLRAAQRPAIIAGRGAVLAGAGPALRRLGERTGAVLATSAVANGLFAGDAYDIGIAGGFSSPTAARLLREADTVIALSAALDGHTSTRRTPELAADIEAGAWRNEPYEESTAGLDPRTLSIALDDLLPAERIVVVDSGHFMGWPSMYLRVPDAQGFVFPQAFQCVGLGLGNAIGAAIARPDRLTVAALGDGGALLALPEFETLGRLQLPVLVVIYDDAAYGAEVHHFRPMGEAVDLAQFPDTDFVGLATAAGCDGTTELDDVRDWLERRDGPMVLDARIDPDIVAEWLEEAFR